MHMYVLSPGPTLSSLSASEVDGFRRIWATGRQMKADLNLSEWMEKVEESSLISQVTVGCSVSWHWLYFVRLFHPFRRVKQSGLNLETGLRGGSSHRHTFSPSFQHSPLFSPRLSALNTGMHFMSDSILNCPNLKSVF